MRLLLMRHGIAASLNEKIKTDAERPLTETGRQKTKQAAQGLLALNENINLIATSPLLRAMQTAEVVQQVWQNEKSQLSLETWPELEHASFRALHKRLEKLPTTDTILLVGHEPGLSRFVAQTLTGSPTGFDMEFKKAGVCALEVADVSDSFDATLLWYATPKQLRLMG